MEINELLDAVKEAQRVPSDNKLAQKINAGATQLRMWRKGVYHPKDHTLATLCEMANISVEAGLLWLNVWRADEKAKPIYEKLALDAEKRASKDRKAA